MGAIKTDGTAWTWGYNTNGVLGHNDRVLRSSPTQLPGTWGGLGGAGGLSTFYLLEPTD